MATTLRAQNRTLRCRDSEIHQTNVPFASRERSRRDGGSDHRAEGSSAAEEATASPASSFRLRFRASEPDLARELDALDDDDRARVAEILRAERQR